MDTIDVPDHVRVGLVDKHVGDPAGAGAVRLRKPQDRAAAEPGQVGHESS
jgi:hypothetical protein